MNEKSAYIQNLRIIATIIVVLGHATMLYDNWGYINVNHEQSDFFMKMRYYICFVQMPLFFSLSGYLQSYINSLTIPSPVSTQLLFCLPFPDSLSSCHKSKKSIYGK